MTTTSTNATAAWLRATRRRSPACCRGRSPSSPPRVEGTWLTDVDGRRFLDLDVGHRRHQRRPLPPAGRRRDRTPRSRELMHTSVVAPPPAATSSWPRRLGAARARSSTSRRCSSATRAPRRSTARSSWPAGPPAGPASSPSAAPSTAARSAATSLTTAKAQVPRGLRAAPRRRHRRAYACRCATAATAAAPAALAALDELLAAPGAAGHGGGDDRRAGARRGRLRRAAGRVAARPARALRPRTASCSCSTRCSAAWAAPVGRSRPRRFGVRARRAPVRQGHRVGPAARRHRRRRPLHGPLADRRPRHAPSAATRWLRGRPRHASTCSSDDGLFERGRARSATGSRAGCGHAASATAPCVDVRGVGLMIGVELATGATAAAVQQRCFDDGAARAHLRAARRACCGSSRRSPSPTTSSTWPLSTSSRACRSRPVPSAALIDALGGRSSAPQHVLTDADVRAGYEVDWTGRFRGAAAGGRAARDRPTRWPRWSARAPSHGVAVVPQGGNTGLVGGGVPAGGRGGAVAAAARRRSTPSTRCAGQVTAGAGVTLARRAGAAPRRPGWAFGVDLARPRLRRRSAAWSPPTPAASASLRHGATRAQVLGRRGGARRRRRSSATSAGW